MGLKTFHNVMFSRQRESGFISRDARENETHYGDLLKINQIYLKIFWGR